ncbi:hypothetical protein Pcinc_010656 [Petrolisthes cinctipes]|uniref:Uncharacterized protein n=1 Tax=Petrolisthes cinctipes TaxID=88211 RepID=A0AAE1G2W0_PETCI|nr:hypothetical protein Pcinc_010656 [Petrolisthes cinctipes]
MRNLSALWASHKAAAHDGEKTGVDSRTGSHNRTLREWNVHSSHSQDYGVLYGEGFTVDQLRPPEYISGTVNVRGWISHHGMGDMHHIQGRFNAQKYVEILTNDFLPSFANRNPPFPEGPVYFVHDRCLIHQAMVV